LFAAPGAPPAFAKVNGAITRFEASCGAGYDGGRLLADMRGVCERAKAWRTRAKAALDADAGPADLAAVSAAHAGVGAVVPLAVFIDVQLAWLGRHAVHAAPSDGSCGLDPPATEYGEGAANCEVAAALATVGWVKHRGYPWWPCTVAARLASEAAEGPLKAAKDADGRVPRALDAMCVKLLGEAPATYGCARGRLVGGGGVL
jgi:hypothetical protein